MADDWLVTRCPSVLAGAAPGSGDDRFTRRSGRRSIRGSGRRARCAGRIPRSCGGRPATTSVNQESSTQAKCFSSPPRVVVHLHFIHELDHSRHNHAVKPLPPLKASQRQVTGRGRRLARLSAEAVGFRIWRARLRQRRAFPRCSPSSQLRRRQAEASGPDTPWPAQGRRAGHRGMPVVLATGCFQVR
jgi:hypothetical protein